MPPTYDNTRPTSPSYDVVIVGAGLAGLSAAYNLKCKKKDINILVLEARGAFEINYNEEVTYNLFLMQILNYVLIV